MTIGRGLCTHHECTQRQPGPSRRPHPTPHLLLIHPIVQLTHVGKRVGATKLPCYDVEDVRERESGLDLGINIASPVTTSSIITRFPTHFADPSSSPQPLASRRHIHVLLQEHVPGEFPFQKNPADFSVKILCVLLM